MSNIISKIKANLTSIPPLNPPKTNLSQTSNIQINNNVNNTAVENFSIDNNSQSSQQFTKEEVDEIASRYLIYQYASYTQNGNELIMEMISGNQMIFINNELVDMLDPNGNSILKTPEMYSDEADEYGLYGGNQKNIYNNFIRYSYIDNFKTIKDIIEKYYPNGNYSQDDLLLLALKMNDTGCGYIAFINTVFEETKNLTDAEFYDKFGFNRYILTSNYDGTYSKVYNYDYMFLDFFLYYQKNYNNFSSIQDINGNSSINSQNRTVTFDTLTGTAGTYSDIVAVMGLNYLREKGINLIIDSPTTAGGFDTNILKDALQQDKKIIIAMYNFTMYSTEDIDGNGLLDDVLYSNLGGHAMVVTGITEDGDYIVSSWGQKYIVRPNLQGTNKEEWMMDYRIYDYNVN